jgi:hypothetical protein
MRNFSKTLISMAAVMAVGSAMAAGAMAADLTATYANGTVSISGVTPGKSQYTLLVVQGVIPEGGSALTYKAETGTIKQIEQNDAGKAFTSTTVGTLDAGSYKVLVGNNDGTVDSGIFTVTGTSVEPDVPTEYPQILVGDTDLNDNLSNMDATRILRRVADVNRTDYKYTGQELDTPVAGETIMVGDTDLNGKLSNMDATRILRRVADVNRTDYKNTGEWHDVLTRP